MSTNQKEGSTNLARRNRLYEKGQGLVWGGVVHPKVVGNGVEKPEKKSLSQPKARQVKMEKKTQDLSQTTRKKIFGRLAVDQTARKKKKASTRAAGGGA